MKILVQQTGTGRVERVDVPAPVVGPGQVRILTRASVVSVGTERTAIESLEAAGLFDEDVGNYSEDFDLWCRVAYAGGRIDYQRRRLVFHRVHGESLTASPLVLPKGALRVLEKLERTMDLSPREREALVGFKASIASAVLAEEAKRAIGRKDYCTAKEKLSRSVALKPSLKRRLVLLALRTLPRSLGFIWRPVCPLLTGRVGGSRTLVEPRLNFFADYSVEGLERNPRPRAGPGRPECSPANVAL